MNFVFLLNIFTLKTTNYMKTVKYESKLYVLQRVEKYAQLYSKNNMST